MSTGQSTGTSRYAVLICIVVTLGGLLFSFNTAVTSGAIEKPGEVCLN